MTKTKQNDFIEIEFTATDAEGNIFDSNIKKDVEKADLNIKEVKPFILSIGNNMILKGIDKDLEDKEIGKEYSIRLNPEDAFGKRDSKLVKMIPLNAFLQQNIRPQPGMQLSLDGRIVKVLSVSGGRVLVDFNNPMAGKQVKYDYKILRKVEDEKEKINSLQEFFFRRKFDFTTSEDKITITVPEQAQKVLEIMAQPFEKILNKKVEFKPEKKESKEKQTKDNSNKTSN